MTWRRCCSMSCARFSLRRRPQERLSPLVSPHNPPQAHLICFLTHSLTMPPWLPHSGIAKTQNPKPQRPSNPVSSASHTGLPQSEIVVLALSIGRKMKSCEHPVRGPSIDIGIPMSAHVLQLNRASLLQADTLRAERLRW